MQPSTAGFCVTFLVSVLTVGAQFQGGAEPMTETCLGCICEGISNCNLTMTCSNEVCGPFRITWAYWTDAGKPVLQNDHPSSQGAYERCTVDPYCAAITVQNYIQKYSQDCNRDGRVDCFDYARLHRLGGYGCGAPLEPQYERRFNQCMAHVSQLSGGAKQAKLEE